MTKFTRFTLLLLLCLACAIGQTNAVRILGTGPNAVGSVNASVAGQSGFVNAWYWIIPVYPIGNGPASNSAFVGNVPGTLNTSNFVQLGWTSVPGITSYKVLKTTQATLPATCTCLLATVTANSYSDQGGSLSSYTVTSVATSTGTITLDNQSQNAPFLSYQLSSTPTILQEIGVLSGVITPGHCLQAGTSYGTITDAGAACGSGGGGFTNGSITFGFNGGGSAIANSTLTCSTAPFSGTITGYTIVGAPTGSTQLDIWVANFSTSALPTVANTIVASAPPTLTSGQGVTSTTLTGWSTAVVKGQTVCGFVTSASTLTMATLTLNVTRSN